MKVNYNIQKEERKAMVGIVGKVLETKPTYCGAPSFSYKVGAFEITKDGILCFDGAADEATVTRVRTAHDARQVSRPRMGRTRLSAGTQGRMSRAERGRQWKILAKLIRQRISWHQQKRRQKLLRWRKSSQQPMRTAFPSVFRAAFSLRRHCRISMHSS